MLTFDVHVKILYVFVALFFNCVIAAQSFGQSDSPPAQTDTPSSEPSSAGSEQQIPQAQKPRDIVPPQPTLLEATGLAFQMPYVLVKVVIATVGSIASGLTWIATGGNTEAANTVWSSTTSGPWSWPDWVTQQSEQMVP